MRPPRPPLDPALLMSIIHIFRYQLKVLAQRIKTCDAKVSLVSLANVKYARILHARINANKDEILNFVTIIF